MLSLPRNSRDRQVVLKAPKIHSIAECRQSCPLAMLLLHVSTCLFEPAVCLQAEPSLHPGLSRGHITHLNEGISVWLRQLFSSISDSAPCEAPITSAVLWCEPSGEPGADDVSKLPVLPDDGQNCTRQQAASVKRRRCFKRFYSRHKVYIQLGPQHEAD